MTTKQDELTKELAELPPEMRFVFAPLVKRAFGFGMGATAGLGIFLLTILHMLRPAGTDSIWLLQHYFRGYRPDDWKAPFIGLFWGFFTGFVLGWFTAFVRNFVVGLWVFLIKTGARLKAHRDFLDHI